MRLTCKTSSRSQQAHRRRHSPILAALPRGGVRPVRYERDEDEERPRSFLDTLPAESERYARELERR